jgi:hypothetical protein
MLDAILYMLAGFILGFWVASLAWLRSVLGRFNRRYDAGERDL